MLSFISIKPVHTPATRPTVGGFVGVRKDADKATKRDTYRYRRC